MNKREYLIAHLATCEDEGMRAVALVAVRREDVDLDGRKGESVYLDTQLGR